MKDRIGFQIGLSQQLPMNESRMLSLIMGSLDWQEKNGPSIIFVDEPFYRFLYRTGIEEIYQDIIPIPIDVDSYDDAYQVALGLFPCKIYEINNEVYLAGDKESVEAQREELPSPIKEKWHEMLMNEDFILSLHNS